MEAINIHQGFKFTNQKLASELRNLIYNAGGKILPNKDFLECRKSTGVEIVPATEGVSLMNVIRSLYSRGYRVAGATFQFCNDAGRYYSLSFLWELNGKENEALYVELQKLCSGAIWRTKVYLNPEYALGVQTGKYSYSIASCGRNPLFEADGKTVRAIWKLDENKKRIGDKPLPMEPAATLDVVDNKFTLIVA